MRLFGTDGIRGKVNEYPLTAGSVLKLAKAASIVLKKKTSINRVVINKDTRLSGYIFEPAITAGLISMGMDVILVGPLPTPALSLLGKSLRADFSIMITASHNPYQDNGLKFFNSNGFKISLEEEIKIEELFFNYDFENHKIKSNSLGKAERLSDAIGRYSEALKQTVEKNIIFNDLKVVLDTANGAAYKVAPQILYELGADLKTINNIPKKDSYQNQLQLLEEESIKISLKNLFDFPHIKESVENKSLSIHGLIHDIGSGKIKYLNPISEQFENI